MKSDAINTSIPAKTIERLVMYRNLLEEWQAQDKSQIFSRQLADMVRNTDAQVRRDLMAVGYSGSTRSGYRVDELVKAINSILEPRDGITLALTGVGNLGRALLGYFSLQQPRFRIVGVFDNDEQKIHRTILGHHILPAAGMVAHLSANPPQLGVVTVPGDYAQRVVDAYAGAGVKGIVNFAPVPVRVPAGIWLENMHITASFEKAAYFSRIHAQGGKA